MKKVCIIFCSVWWTMSCVGCLYFLNWADYNSCVWIWWKGRTNAILIILNWFWNIKSSVCGQLTRSNKLGLAWFPICRRSLNPFVIASAILVPFLSSRAFVATVVPILIHSIWDTSTGWLAGIDFPVSWKVGNWCLKNTVLINYISIFRSFTELCVLTILCQN